MSANTSKSRSHLHVVYFLYFRSSHEFSESFNLELITTFVHVEWVLKKLIFHSSLITYNQQAWNFPPHLSKYVVINKDFFNTWREADDELAPFVKIQKKQHISLSYLIWKLPCVNSYPQKLTHIIYHEIYLSGIIIVFGWCTVFRLLLVPWLCHFCKKTNSLAFN